MSTLGSGSSPLTRGKHAVALNRIAFTRLIPAHAGKTGTLGRSYPTFPAHPRSRGENAQTVEVGAHLVGSSPLTRGKLDKIIYRAMSTGLIPAHAGKTSCATATTGGTVAHPRSRGENVAGSQVGPEEHGSSPLTRGKLPSNCARRRRRRLIPAHAGKTG